MQPPDLLTNSGYRDCRVKVLELVFSGMSLHSLIFKSSLFAKSFSRGNQETTWSRRHGSLGSFRFGHVSSMYRSCPFQQRHTCVASSMSTHATDVNTPPQTPKRPPKETKRHENTRGTYGTASNHLGSACSDDRVTTAVAGLRRGHRDAQLWTPDGGAWPSCRCCCLSNSWCRAAQVIGTVENMAPEAK